jgi:hypothetical protein
MIHGKLFRFTLIDSYSWFLLLQWRRFIATVGTGLGLLAKRPKVNVGVAIDDTQFFITYDMSMFTLS